jgi:hypothetical protein
MPYKVSMVLEEFPTVFSGSSEMQCLVQIGISDFAFWGKSRVKGELIATFMTLYSLDLLF